MNADGASGSTSIEDVRQAIEALSSEDLYRLRKAARIFIGGTEYADEIELLNETVVRTLRRANGERGRHWPKEVPFVAFLIQTMEGLADDSRNSVYMMRTDESEALAEEGQSAEEALGSRGHAHPDLVTLVIEQEDRDEELEKAQQDVNDIDAFFAGDEGVGWLLMGHKDGLKAAEIREISGMSQTQYETARKRLRRGVEKLFPGRSVK